MIIMPTICDEEQTIQFLEYLDSEEFKDIKFDSWTAGCVHQRGIETAVVRILTVLMSAIEI